MHQQFKLSAISSLVAATLAAALSGCATTNARVDAVAADTSAQIESERSRSLASVMQRREQILAAQEVSKPFISGAPVPLDRDASMPAYLRRTPTILFNRGPITLPNAINQISEASGVQISVAPDALLPPAAFSSRSGAASAATPATVTLSNLPAGTPLYSVLDEMARQAQVSWVAQGLGVHVFRTQTKVFSLSAIAQTFTNSTSMGRAGGKNDAFTSSNTTSFETKGSDILTGLEKSVTALLTAGGRAVLSSETQSLVVTDTPASLKAIEDFVNAANKTLTRRVRMVVEVIDVTAKDSAEAGIDWNLLSKGLSAGGVDITAGAPSSLTTPLAGGIRIASFDGALAGSTVILKALSEVGTIVNRRTFPLVTVSGKPVTQAVRNTFSYVDQVTQNTTTSATTVPVAPTVMQKEETVGTFLTVLPTARPDGQISMILSYDQTTADPLVPFTTGSGTNSVTVQQKSTNGTGFIREVNLRSGQTMLVGGVDTVLGQNTVRRMANGMPMLAGGSDKSSLTKTITIVLITAVAEEGI